MIVHTIPGPNILLEGPTGTGKTTALLSLMEAGLETFVLFTEPGMEVVSHKSCEDGLHWAYIPPATADWDDLIDSADKINKLAFKSLAEMPGINKTKYRQFYDVLVCLSDFHCDRCGKDFGDVSEWDTSRALVVDSLSGLNIMAMNLVVGSKPTKSMSDWGVAMDNLSRLVQKLCMDTRCTFVLNGHVERETDEITGSVKVMASTLGRKLAPVIPRFFSDVVLTVRQGKEFSWSTADTSADLKARNLPIAEKIKPSFVQILDRWKEAGGVIAPRDS